MEKDDEIPQQIAERFIQPVIGSLDYLDDLALQKELEKAIEDYGADMYDDGYYDAQPKEKSKEDDDK